VWVQKLLRFKFHHDSPPLTVEQAKWLASELRSHRPLNTMGAPEQAAIKIEFALETQEPDPDVEHSPQELRAMIDLLYSDIFDDAPEPYALWRNFRAGLRAADEAGAD
jgi:hypothetical protein